MKNVFILDCKKEIDRFVAETIDIDLPSIALPVVLKEIIEILNDDMLDKRTIYGAACDYVCDRVKDIHFDPVHGDDAERLIYSAMLRLAGAIRNKLRHHHAYADGQFPFTFKNFMNNGTFYLTRKRETAHTQPHHS